MNTCRLLKNAINHHISKIFDDVEVPTKKEKEIITSIDIEKPEENFNNMIENSFTDDSSMFIKKISDQSYDINLFIKMVLKYARILDDNGAKDIIMNLPNLV